MIALGLGLLAGLLTSIPMLGPVVLLLFTAGLDGTKRRALALAAGAALAEGAHVALVVFGVAPRLLAVPGVAVWARLVSGVVLIAIAVVAWRTRAQPRVFEAMGAGRAFVLGLGLVALNPGFTLTWLAVVAALDDVALGWSFVVGTVLGILAWFGIVVGLALRIGPGLAPRLVVVRAVVAVALAGIGLWLVVQGFLGP